jgi:hypothetical protein
MFGQNILMKVLMKLTYSESIKVGKVIFFKIPVLYTEKTKTG